MAAAAKPAPIAMIATPRASIQMTEAFAAVPGPPVGGNWISSAVGLGEAVGAGVCVAGSAVGVGGTGVGVGGTGVGVGAGV